jgi:hypothetical protein
MNKVMLAFTILLLGAGEAMAVDIINRDSRDYDVKVNSNFVFISSRSQKNDICFSSCAIELGKSRIIASGRDLVIIEGGRLRKE